MPFGLDFDTGRRRRAVENARSDPQLQSRLGALKSKIPNIQSAFPNNRPQQNIRPDRPTRPSSPPPVLQDRLQTFKQNLPDIRQQILERRDRRVPREGIFPDLQNIRPTPQLTNPVIRVGPGDSFPSPQLTNPFIRVGPGESFPTPQLTPASILTQFGPSVLGQPVPMGLQNMHPLLLQMLQGFGANIPLPLLG